MIARAIVGLIPVHFGLDPPHAGKIQFGKGADIVTEMKVLIEGLTIHLDDIGACLYADMEALGLHADGSAIRTSARERRTDLLFGLQPG